MLCYDSETANCTNIYAFHESDSVRGVSSAIVGHCTSYAFSLHLAVFNSILMRLIECMIQIFTRVLLFISIVHLNKFSAYLFIIRNLRHPVIVLAVTSNVTMAFYTLS